MKENGIPKCITFQVRAEAERKHDSPDSFQEGNWTGGSGQSLPFSGEIESEFLKTRRGEKNKKATREPQRAAGSTLAAEPHLFDIRGPNARD